jgi:hypothetical protein
MEYANVGTHIFKEPQTHATRLWTDFQIWSHLPFAAVVVLSIYEEFYEMTVLVSAVLISSVIYHLGAEEINVFSYIDNCTAFTLSMYGNVQLFFSPSVLILCINLALGFTSGLIFISGCIEKFKPYYGQLHPVGLHILPAAWCTLVVMFQKPFLF